MAESVTLQYLPLTSSRPDCLALLTMNRPKQSNALNREMLVEMRTHLREAARNKNLRVLLLGAVGKHFSAGADLHWMQASARLNQEENVAEAHLLTEMFEALYHFPLPTIAVVKGAVYGGAVGLTAACDIVLCEAQARFCLSEVRLGLIPAVILPYLGRRMQPGQLRRHSLSARIFSAADALQYGLVDQTVNAADFVDVLQAEIQQLLEAGPAAQKRLKSLHQFLQERAFVQCEETAQAIAAVRTAAEGQAGLAAFFAKTASPWIIQIEKSSPWMRALEQVVGPS